MIEVKQSFETPQEARVALSYFSYWSALYDFDEYLRITIKHGAMESDGEYEAYEKIREKLNEVMEEHNVSLLDIL